MAITTFIGAENLIAFGLIQAEYAKKDYVTEPELHELARTLQTCFNDNKINAIVQDASISYAVYGSEYFKKEKIDEENRYSLASNLTTTGDLKVRFLATLPLEVHATIEGVLSAAHNRGIISKIKSDLEKMCGTMTYKFDDHRPTYDEIISKANDVLDHYCGTDRKLTPEQFERFKAFAEEASTPRVQSADNEDRPGVYKLVLYVDNDGCLRIAKTAPRYVEIIAAQGGLDDD